MRYCESEKRVFKGGDNMKDFLKTFWQREWVKFLGRMFFYFAVFLVLVYLYGYSGIEGGTFIYNEF